MYQVVGYQYKDYVNKRGDKVRGYSVFTVSFDEARSSDDWKGRTVETFWLSVELFEGNNIALGEIIEVFYNKYGRVTNVRVVEEPEALIS